MANINIPKSINFSEHFAEYVGIGPSSTSKNLVHIQFLSNLQPSILNTKSSAEAGKTDLTIGALHEITHECTVFMPLSQIYILKLALDQAIKQIEGKDE